MGNNECWLEHIHLQCIYGIFGREFTEYTVIYGVYKWFWPTIGINNGCVKGGHTVKGFLVLGFQVRLHRYYYRNALGCFASN